MAECSENIELLGYSRYRRSVLIDQPPCPTAQLRDSRQAEEWESCTSAHELRFEIIEMMRISLLMGFDVAYHCLGISACKAHFREASRKWPSCMRFAFHHFVDLPRIPSAVWVGATDGPYCGDLEFKSMRNPSDSMACLMISIALQWIRIQHMCLGAHRGILDGFHVSVDARGY